MIPRYTPPRIAAIFSDESRLRRWLEVELLAAEGWSLEGHVPAEAVTQLRRHARVDAARVAELEAEQGHDVAAFVSAVQESVGDEGRFIHLGLTSADVVDTTLATQLRDALAIVDSDARELEGVLAERAVEHRVTVMPGRTHGVHAEPVTLGVKLANHFDEVRRSRLRLAAAAAEVAVGKVSGTVGTHISVPPRVEEHVCRGLGLEVAPASTQVVARDRHAAVVNAMALFGGVLERLATAIRLLQVTEVSEAEEPFAERQKGSSAMPHKRNPVLCERICGMARVLRGNAVTALEDVALWHERDISHSSAERLVLPDACALLDYMLQLSTRIVRGLRFDTARMRENVAWGGGLVFSQRLLNALVLEAGWTRERAYRAVQDLAFAARDGRGGFRDLVAADPAISDALRAAKIDLHDIFDIAVYLRGIDETYARLGLSTSVSEPVASTQQPKLAVEAGLGGGAV